MDFIFCKFCLLHFQTLMWLFWFLLELCTYFARFEKPKKIKLNPLSANPTKWSSTIKQFVGFCRRIIWVCLTILWGWHLKGFREIFIASSLTHFEPMFSFIPVLSRVLQLKGKWKEILVRIWFSDICSVKSSANILIKEKDRSVYLSRQSFEQGFHVIEVWAQINVNLEKASLIFVFL